MNARRLSVVLRLTVVLALGLFLLSAYMATKVLQTKATGVREAKLQSRVLEENQRQLGQARADIQKYQALGAIAKSIVPQDKDQARTVREIVQLAGQYGIKLGAINFPASSLGDKKSAQSQLQAAKGLSGVYILEITVQSDTNSPAPFDSFLSFLRALEHNRRTALVNGIIIQPDVANPNLTSFTLTISEYIKP
jgi:hypothetical protein